MKTPIVVSFTLLTALLAASVPDHRPASTRDIGPDPLPCLHPVDPYDSGGPLAPDEAVYDVGYYDLAVEVTPTDSSVRGRVDVHATVVSPTERIGLDLDTLLAIRSVRLLGAGTGAERSFVTDDVGGPLPFDRCGGRVRVSLPRTWQPGEPLALRVEYGGRPRVAPRPPWDGGFTWARTADGSPWIATSNQMIGPDVWWPVKDHVSDEPDSMAITVTAPAPLVVATNGRLRGVDDAGSGRRTWRWFVSTPVNAYDVALNIAPYRTIDTTVASVAGDSIPVFFFVLPEDYEKGVRFFPEVLAQLRWYEQTLGPYPWRADKYGVVQTPHLGMEHQSIIAYGARFSNAAMTGGQDWGFDALLHHELSHEWWGNLVTNADWKDMWLHEGFGSYMQALYIEDRDGAARYREFMESMRPRIGNRKPVAPETSTSAQQIYAGHDIYFKGAWILHTLRWVIGDEAFFRALRRMAYPDPALARTTDGRAARFATTTDFRTIAEAEAGRDLGWFFEAYLRTAALPRLVADRSPDRLELRWESPDGHPFPMPVEIGLGDRTVRMTMEDGTGSVSVPAGVEPVVDPDDWLLRARER